MATNGKKINELTAISEVSNETVLPAVYVNGTQTNSTANKISIQQINDKIIANLETVLDSKQDKLTQGDNISIEGNVISALVPQGVFTESNLVQGTGITLTKNIETGVTTIDATATGGGAPTLTWYKDNTGTEITISDTSSASLVKIYKNGILLEPTEDYTLSGTALTLVTALTTSDKITVEVFD